MVSADRLISVLYRGVANTQYAITAVMLQYAALHKAQQLIGDFNALCQFQAATDEQRTKAVEFTISYSEELHSLLGNAGVNKDKIAYLIAQTLEKLDELCADIVANPPPQTPQEEVVTEAKRKPGRPKAVVAEDHAPL